MLRTEWKRVEELFHLALEQPSAERQAFLASRCAGEPALRDEVESLLAARDRAGSFLDHPTLDVTGKRRALAELEDLAGRRLGPYHLIREIGHGGMGRVYLAERRDREFERQVAVKLVDRRIADDELLERFRRERQTLARLTHPNIAHLYEGGTAPDGTPFFVMELVDGLPIDDYCDRNRLTVDERLELFGAVCDAVRYAHRNLIVHRDIKASNILVTEEGRPKLLDFGIARPLVAPEPADRTRTALRTFTPRYASPEQLRGEPPTTASDVYSLGVLLYKLLTGSFPREPSDLTEGVTAAFEGEVTRPSEVVEGPGAEREPEAQELARRRGTSGARLRRQLSGDLDNIALMALRTEPDRRYPSVDALMRDLEAYRRGLPVEARADSLGYRAGKFLRRNRLAVAFAATVVALLLATTVMLAAMAFRIAEERDLAQRERDKANQVSDYLVSLFQTADPTSNPGGSMSVRELLDRGAGTVSQRLAGQEQVQAAMLDAVGRAYLGLALYDQAAPLLERALELRRESLGEEHAEVAASYLHLGALYRVTDEFDQAAANFERALAIQRRLDPESADAGLTVAHLAELAQARGDYDASESLTREALRISRATAGDESAEVAMRLFQLAQAYHHQGRDEAARSTLSRAIEVGQRTLGPDHSELLSMKRSLGLLLRKEYRLAEAEALYREILASERRLFGEEHRELSFTLNHLGLTLAEQGRAEEAIEHVREALRIRRKLLGDDHLAVAVSLNSLGYVESLGGDLAAAEDSYRRSLEIVRGRATPAPRQLSTALGGLGRVLRLQGRTEAAERALAEALAELTSFLDDGHPLVIGARIQLGLCRAELGLAEEAEALLEAALAALSDQPLEPGSRLRAPLTRLAEHYEIAGRPDRARRVRALLEG